jgi:hypothetical protein
MQCQLPAQPGQKSPGLELAWYVVMMRMAMYGFFMPREEGEF